MKYIKQIAILLLTLCLCVNTVAETKIIAKGDWSEAVGDDQGYMLRGRLLLCVTPMHRGPSGTDTAVYLELQESSDFIGNTLKVYCNMDGDTSSGPDFQTIEKAGMSWNLHDAGGNPLMQSLFAYSGASPGKYWMTLPYDSTVRLRASRGGGRMDDGSLGIALPSIYWVVPAKTTNEYYLSGTFTVSPPISDIDQSKYHIWQGKLKLPKMKIPI